MKRAAVGLLCCLVGTIAGAEAPAVSRVVPEGQFLGDARLGKQRTLNDAYHPWTPPATRSAWEQESERLRRQVLVSNGLWPMPPKEPLQPVIHGRIDRDDYTIEKVYFASHPGHYVTGNLYRPKNVEGRVPGVLCPHGHWANARFYDAGEKAAAQLIASGGETYPAAARHHIQARAVHLARMGCVVFHYDMVGYSDSRQLGHRDSFQDVEAALRLQNTMGLQTFNSIRALDFLVSLPEVDPQRLAITGASGGGTQTFILGAIDPRLKVAFPAVMVSTAMQGGCVCENAEYLRLGCNNIALAALFAPRPLAMTGANDWTVDIEIKGLPELKQVYNLLGHPQHVDARAYPQYGHNYNQVSRQMMYDWFHRHLGLAKTAPLLERDFAPASQDELTVFDGEHALPADAVGEDGLREYLTAVAEKQFASLVPENKNQLDEYRRVIGSAAQVMLDEGVPDPDQVERVGAEEPLGGTVTLVKGLVSRAGSGERIPALLLHPDEDNDTVVVWIDGRGKSHLFDEHGEPNEAAETLLSAGYSVASADVFLTGEFVGGGEVDYPEVNAQYVGYTFGYNRPVLSQRVRDILTTISVVKDVAEADHVILVGTGEAGPWAALAAGLAGDELQRAIVDLNGFHFGKVKEIGDPMLLPGALKYGDIGGLTALAAPIPLTVGGTATLPEEALGSLAAVYRAAGAPLKIEPASLSADAAVKLIVQQ